MNNLIDTNFDFTTDNTYWKNFWERRERLGGGSCDPDSDSPTLRKYHQLLWSKQLPNGEFMNLQYGTPKSKNYLTWKNFRFASDSIITSFRYKSMKQLFFELEKVIPNYKKWMETFIRQSYTIGGMLIFPKHPNSINGCRGTNPKIRDRIDLTLECIRRYYNKETSPISWVLEKDRNFFDLFVDFEGYVDFFLMQDIVSEDYKSIKFFLDFKEFNFQPLPKNIDEYLLWYQQSIKFLTARNNRINKWKSQINE